MKIEVYDPAMCCSTGVCGPSADAALVEFAGVLKGLDTTRFQVERYNLAQQPEAYAMNPRVAEILKDQGTDALPLVYVDEKLVCSGTYPTPEELGALLNMEHREAPGSSSCCSGECC